MDIEKILIFSLFLQKNILKNLFRARYSIFSWFSRYKIYFLCTFAYLPSLFFLHYLLNIIYFCSKLFSSYYCSYVPIYYIVFFAKDAYCHYWYCFFVPKRRDGCAVPLFVIFCVTGLAQKTFGGSKKMGHFILLYPHKASGP